MKRAHEILFISGLFTADARAPMGTGIDHATKAPGLVSRNKDRHPADFCCDEIVGLSDLTFMRNEHPVAFENVLYLKLKHFGVGKSCAIYLKDAARFILGQPGLQPPPQDLQVGNTPHQLFFRVHYLSLPHRPLGPASLLRSLGPAAIANTGR